MKRFTQTFQIIFIFFLPFAFTSLASHNMPIFYKANFFGGMPKTDQRDWVSHVHVRYASGDTRTGFNTSGTKRNILNLYGKTNVSLLAVNVENVTPETKPVTHEYLNPIPGTELGIIPGYNFTGDDGTFTLNGSFKMHEIDLIIHQNLRYGLYAKAYVPFRSLKVRDIKVINNTAKDNPNFDDFQDFLNNQLDTVLKENGLQPLRRPFKSCGISDPVLYVGWQGYYNGGLNLVKDISGQLEVGAIVPAASSLDKNRVVTLPRGYNGHWGVSLRAHLEAAILTQIVTGAYGGIDILDPHKTTHRMKTDKEQTGLIFLEKGRVDVNPGSIWQLGFYVKIHPFLKGISIVGGYSFAQQERTKLHVKDNDFLKTFIENEKQLVKNGDIIIAETKGNIVNPDKRFGSWKQHVLHFLAQVDLGEHLNFIATPLVAFFYDYPIAGRRSYRTNMIGGTGGLKVTWRWK